MTQLSHVHRTAIGAASMFSDADIHRAAKELVERYGDNALAVRQEHLAAHSAAQDESGINIALRVLSAVEAPLPHRREATQRRRGRQGRWVEFADSFHVVHFTLRF